MRLATALVAVLLALDAHAFEGRELLRCQQTVARAAARLVARRRQALARCVTKALRCPSALAAGASADTDACLAAVATRCRRQLVPASRAATAVELAGSLCTAPAPPGDGASVAGVLDDDGLGFDQLPDYCPGIAASPDDPDALARCQSAALVCTSDAAVATAAPRAPEVLVRLGVALPGCSLAGLCGNGRIDGDEECDDGAANSDTTPNACRTSCVEATCGDGVVDDGEDCDDGNTIDGDGCDSDCTATPSVCGNGIVEGDEECDDGNTVDGDGCDADCFLPGGECGDGRVDPDEECDAGSQNSDRLPDRCRTDCSLPYCGDGVVDVGHGETCEPPGTLLCADDCTLRLPGPLGLATAAMAPDLMHCQDVVLRDGARLFAAGRSLVGRCVLAAERCDLGISEDADPDGTRAAACLDAATRRCEKARSRRDALRADVVAALASACGGIPLGSLLDDRAGLGFGDVAGACPAPTGADPATGDLVACVADTLLCRAETAVASTVPRAEDFLADLDLAVDPADAFPCLADPADQ